MKDRPSSKRFMSLLVLVMFIIAQIHNLEAKALTVCSIGKQNGQKVVCGSLANSQPTKRCQEQYSNQKNGTEIKMCLMQLNGVQILIELFNKNTFKSYELRINQEFIESSKDKKYPLNEPEEFMDVLQTNFANLSITQNGIIIYHYSIGRSNKTIILAAKQVSNSFNEAMIREHLKLKQKFQDEIRKNTLQKQSFEKALKEIKDLLLAQNRLIREEVSKNAQSCSKSIQKASAGVQSNEVEINKINGKLQKQDLNDQINPIDNSDRHLFQIHNYHDNSLLIKKIAAGNAGTYHNTYLTPTIQPKTITSIKIRALSKDLWAGISTANTFGKVDTGTWQNLQTVNLCIYCGNMHIKGQFYNIMPGQPDNTFIEMIVDTNKWTITWIFNQNQRVVSEIIPQIMRSKPIYWQFSIGKAGAAIQLFK